MPYAEHSLYAALQVVAIYNSPNRGRRKTYGLYNRHHREYNSYSSRTLRVDMPHKNVSAML